MDNEGIILIVKTRRKTQVKKFNLYMIFPGKLHVTSMKYCQIVECYKQGEIKIMFHHIISILCLTLKILLTLKFGTA